MTKKGPATIGFVARGDHMEPKKSNWVFCPTRCQAHLWERAGVQLATNSPRMKPFLFPTRVPPCNQSIRGHGHAVTLRVGLP